MEQPRKPSASPPPPSPEDDELLDSGQEEVFSREEVERGKIEHGAASGDPDAD